MSSSVHHRALLRSSSSGLGGATEARTGVQLIDVRHLYLIVCACARACTLARMSRAHTHTHASTHVCAKHRPHARHSYQGIPFGP